MVAAEHRVVGRAPVVVRVRHPVAPGATPVRTPASIARHGSVVVPRNAAIVATDVTRVATRADLVRAVRGADKAAIVDARLFDRFAGQGVPEGQVSLAVEVELQPLEKSFTDAELKAIADKVVAAAAKVGATLRG